MYQLPENIIKIYHQKNQLLALHSNWKIGGIADYIFYPNSIEEISDIYKFATISNIPVVVIGYATNILFDDAGFRGFIIKLTKNFSLFSVANDKITAQAGIWVPYLSRIALQNNLTGLEHISGIPGSLGGLVNMNGGSLRKSISENIQKVTSINTSGNIENHLARNCSFVYRKSIFQKTKLIIVEIELLLRKDNYSAIHQNMLKILTERSKKFPRKIPNCGSVFKNDPEIFEKYGPPGKIIENLGLKGTNINGAEISNLHANFIVNTNNASSKDIISLVQFIRKRVFDRLNINLESEIRYCDSNGNVCFLHEVKSEF